jgi:hypothetical protein
MTSAKQNPAPFQRRGANDQVCLSNTKDCENTLSTEKLQALRLVTRHGVPPVRAGLVAALAFGHGRAKP